jgi:hypothetical protein
MRHKQQASFRSFIGPVLEVNEPINATKLLDHLSNLPTQQI